LQFFGNVAERRQRLAGYKVAGPMTEEVDSP
jgi:hypothetical protein